ncbi:MAG: glycosyltransferase family 2 protein [Pseudonocardiaceae bacterium]
MPTVSILTAAYAPTAKYLPETIASVREQILPTGWSLEWIVQEDGVGPRLADHVNELPYARYQANDVRLGLSQTRNLGLSRAIGDLVQVLDHDDVLLPGALATLVSRFVDYPIQWAVGQADDLTPDGTRVAYESALPYGVLPAGCVNAWATENGGNWPIHCAGLMMRTGYLRALGGWVASPADDDVAMFAALSELTNGYNEPTVTWLYRHHPEQTHRMPEWHAWSTAGRRIALQRIDALRKTGLYVDPERSLRSDDGVNAPIEVGQLHPKKNHPGV